MLDNPFQREGKWWFFDDGGFACGPYDEKEHAQTALGHNEDKVTDEQVP